MFKSNMPAITVLISTYNRANYLEKVLASFTSQTLPVSEFEIVLINDGSDDDTADVVNKFQNCLPIRYFSHENRGLAASKNRGIEEAKAPIIIFVDDDDLATPQLLEEHLSAHKKYSDESYAVLGYTDLDEFMTEDPLMKYITGVGCQLFSYPMLNDGDVLDYTYFWGGRSSCKVSFLRRHGMFDPIFKFGCEDVELGYRLSSDGLKVVYQQSAKSIMMRPISVDDFFKRLIRQGESQRVFAQLHHANEIQRLCEVVGADELWADVESVFEVLLSSARNLDSLVRSRRDLGLYIDDLTMQLLYRSYGNAFKACKIKGVVCSY